MPSLAEQIAATDAKLNALLAAGASITSGESTKEVSLTEALGMINEELSKKDSVSKERAAYLRSVLAEITKALHFEAGETPSISIKVIDDPDQVKPATATSTLNTIGDGAPNPSNLQENRTTVSVAGLKSPTPVINFASSLAKAQAIQAMLIGGPAEIRKSKLTDKLDEIKSLFKISDDDLKGDGYDLRWKIGDLLQLLINAVKVEQLAGDGGVEKTETAKAAGGEKKTAEVAWPRDMSSAKFDEKAGVFKNEPGAWDDRA